MKDEIDTLLNAWAARRAPDERCRMALEDRVLWALGQRRLPTPPQHRTWLHALACFATGVAATLVAVFFLRQDEEGGDRWKDLLLEERGLFAERRPAVVRVFEETERLFGSNLLWVAQSGRDVDLGVSEAAWSGESLVVRITLVARSQGSEEWRRVWKTEVVARTDDVLEMPTPGGAPSRVAIWMHRLDRCSVLVESRLTLQKPLRMDAEASEVLKFGATRSVTRFRHGDTEYRLLQTVAPIGGGACSS